MQDKLNADIHTLLGLIAGLRESGEDTELLDLTCWSSNWEFGKRRYPPLSPQRRQVGQAERRQMATTRYAVVILRYAKKGEQNAQTLQFLGRLQFAIKHGANSRL